MIMEQRSEMFTEPKPLFYVVEDFSIVNEYISSDSEKKCIILMALNLMPYYTKAKHLLPEVESFRNNFFLPVYQVSKFWDEESKSYLPLYLIRNRQGVMRWVTPPVPNWSYGFIPVFCAKDYMMDKSIDIKTEVAKLTEIYLN